MAGDERRTEIEAGVWHKDGPLAQIEAMAQWVAELPTEHVETRDKIVKNLRAALDRVRDARGEDEARCPNCGGTKDDPRGLCPDPGHNRSPQGEDHDPSPEWRTPVVRDMEAEIQRLREELRLTKTSPSPERDTEKP